MLILTTDQVTTRQAIRRHNSQVERILAIMYRRWLFIQGESYSSEEKAFALKQTREKLDAGEMCVLVVDNNKNYIIFYEDKNAELVEEKAPTSESLEDLEKLVELIRNESGLIKNNRYKLRMYPNSIFGDEMVTWLSERFQCSREEAVKAGQSLIEKGWLHHTWDEHHFKDERLLYRFYQDEKLSIPFFTG